MDVVVDRCAGVDIGKDEIVACLRTPKPQGGGRRKHTRTFSSFTSGLEAMAEWFSAEEVSQVVMEATGSYWKPVVRHEALLDREGVRDPLLRAVAAAC